MATYCPADRILVTTALFTGASDEPAPGAVAIGGDRILWAGPLETMPEALRGDATEVIDYGDALIMPGFHDAHLHYFHSALYLSPLAERFVGENEADAVGAAGASGCPASCRLMAAYPRLARLPVESRRHAEPRVTGCGLPHTSRGHVLRGRPHAVAEQLRAGTPGHHGGERAARRWQL